MAFFLLVELAHFTQDIKKRHTALDSPVWSSSKNVEFLVLHRRQFRHQCTHVFSFNMGAKSILGSFSVRIVFIREIKRKALFLTIAECAYAIKLWVPKI